MNFLIDTHPFLWSINGERELPPRVKRAMIYDGNECYLSIVSLWEMTIKSGKGQLQLPGGNIAELTRDLAQSQLTLLNIDSLDLPYLERLPMHHRDPFDRLLVAQALRHKLTFVTDDAILPDYGISILWD